MQRPARVLLAGVGPDADPAGAVELARNLRDAGWEVVHLGAVSGPEVVAAVARDEDAAAVVVCAMGPAGAAAVVAAVEAGLAGCGLDGVVVVDADAGTPAVLAALGADGGDPEAAD